MRAFIKRFLLFSLPLALMPVLIYTIDPMGIFREDFRYQVIEPNQRYVKMKWLTKGKRKFDSFIFGSSKVGNIDSRKLRMGKFYNMTYSMGLPYEWFEDMKRLHKRGYKMKNVIICLDEFSYTRTHDQNTSFLRKPYPETPVEQLEFKAKYLLRMPNFPVLKEALYPLNKDKQFLVRYDIHGSGIPFKEEREQYIEENMETHLQDSRFNIDWANKLPRMDESLQAIANMKAYCEEQNIKLTVVYLPVHKKKLAKVKENQFETYKTRLAEITEYLDFSNYQEVSEDNSYWFEQVHFRAKVGDMIVAKLNGNEVLAGFGKYVSRKQLADK